VLYRAAAFDLVAMHALPLVGADKAGACVLPAGRVTTRQLLRAQHERMARADAEVRPTAATATSAATASTTATTATTAATAATTAATTAALPPLPVLLPPPPPPWWLRVCGGSGAAYLQRQLCASGHR
jgi:hypothetical protein